MDRFLVKVEAPPLHKGFKSMEKAKFKEDFTEIYKDSIQANLSHSSNTRNVSLNDDMTSARSDPSTVTLSKRQYEVVMSVLRGQSVFFTGAAGTGKSHVIKVIVDAIKKMKKEDLLSITAPTGVAACNIGGTTLHSWAGIGLGNGPKDEILRKVKNSGEAKKRWRTTEILIIDEISMLNGELFDLLSFIGRHIRDDDRPFGGIQLVLTGDFFQLPPVGLGRGNSSSNVTFCFKSETWEKLFNSNIGQVIVLDKVFRQKDPQFLNLLNQIRVGTASTATSQLLSRRVLGKNPSLLHDSEGRIQTTKLYSLNRDVDSYNKCQISSLEGESITYSAIDKGEDRYISQLCQGLKAPQELELRIGAQVMLLKNLSTVNGLVNGSRGTVVKFVKLEDDSLARDVSTINLFSILPVVKFFGVDMEITIEPSSWNIEVLGREVASRTQLPLMLSWAISVHKAQGLTIPNLEVSFNGLFEYGQAYVALSRATSLEGLFLHNYDPNRIFASQVVKDFYDSLSKSSSSCALSSHNSSTSDEDITISIDDLCQSCVNISEKNSTMTSTEDPKWIRVSHPPDRDIGQPSSSSVVMSESKFTLSSSSPYDRTSWDRERRFDRMGASRSNSNNYGNNNNNNNNGSSNTISNSNSNSNSNSYSNNYYNSSSSNNHSRDNSAFDDLLNNNPLQNTTMNEFSLSKASFRKPTPSLSTTVTPTPIIDLADDSSDIDQSSSSDPLDSMVPAYRSVSTISRVSTASTASTSTSASSSASSSLVFTSNSTSSTIDVTSLNPDSITKLSPFHSGLNPPNESLLSKRVRENKEATAIWLERNKRERKDSANLFLKNLGI